MATRLGDLLDDARRRTFVGRRRELASFDDVLLGRSARRVLLVHGPGGIGKTTLLLEYCTRARDAGRTVLLLDAREIDPSPEGFEDAAAHALGRPFGTETGRRLSELFAGGVLLVDGYEQLGPIDGWLRQAFLPALPADCVVVLAGRETPAAPWRSDPGWRSVVGVHRLGDLDEAESGELLERAGVASAARPQLVRLGRGHPLAMALLADIAVTGTVPDRIAEVPDLVAALLESLLRGAPADAHMTGLAACAMAWLTTEDLLRQVVGAAAGEVWAWLERRPFVIRGPNGLFPHDLARDVLDAEFERRWPERYRALHRVVHDHVVASLRSAAGPDRQMLAQHLLSLHRRSPFSEIIGSLRAQGSAAVVPARREDHEPALSLIEHFEGPRSARLAERWFAEQPEGLNVVRDDQGLASLVFHVMHPTGSPMEDRDPVTRAVLDHATRQGPDRVSRSTSGGSSPAARVPERSLRGAGRPGVVDDRVGVAPAGVVIRRGGRRSHLGADLRLHRVHPAAGGRVRRTGARRLRQRLAAPADRHLARPDERAGALGRHRSAAGVPAAPSPAGPGALRCRGQDRAAGSAPAGPAGRQPADGLVAGGPVDGGPVDSRSPAARAPNGSARPSKTPSAASATSRSRPCCGVPLSAARRPRRPRPKCSACPSVPTGATWPRRWSSSPTCCGRWRSARCACQPSACRPLAAATEQRLSTIWPGD